MNIKKRFFVTLCALSPVALASPALAMPQEQADCALTSLLSNSVQKEVAYRHTFEPFDSSKLDERIAESSDANDVLVACSKKYNWKSADEGSVNAYTTFSLAFEEAASRIQKTGVNVKPLLEAINAVRDEEWVAFERRDAGNVHIFNQIRALLLKQGFDTSKSTALDDQAVNFVTISKLLLDAKIELFNPDRAANRAVLVSRASAPVVIAQAPTERSHADQYNDAGMRDYNEAKHYFFYSGQRFTVDSTMEVCSSIKIAYKKYESARSNFESAIRNYGYGDTKSDPNEDTGQNYETTVSMMNFASEEFNNRGCPGSINN
jgi:hypothetical protein